MKKKCSICNKNKECDLYPLGYVCDKCMDSLCRKVNKKLK